MTCRLCCHELALAEWQKLDGSLREPLKKKMAERLQCPRVPSAALFSMVDCYKIELRRVGYRLIYRVGEEVMFVTALAVGRRDRSQAYEAARVRLKQPISDE